jgi:hypothetical protein
VFKALAGSDRLVLVRALSAVIEYQNEDDDDELSARVFPQGIRKTPVL